MLKFMRRRWAVAAAVTLVAIGATLVGTNSFATGTTTISGTVFGDTDGDGVHDADEFGIDGVAVWVVGDPQGQGTRPAAAARSGTDGSWSVATDQLGSGPFGVGLGDPIDQSGQPVSIESAASVTLPAGLNWTDRGPDHLGRWLTGVAPGTNGLEFGVSTCAASAHCVRPQLGGSVWLDVDRDGTQGPSEPRIPGADVALLSGGSALAELRTDAEGRWVADEGSVAGGLAAIDQVAVSVGAAAAVGVVGEPTQLVPTTPDVGPDVADSDGVALADGTALATLDEGSPLLIVDVGFTSPLGDPSLERGAGPESQARSTNLAASAPSTARSVSSDGALNELDSTARSGAAPPAASTGAAIGGMNGAGSSDPGSASPAVETTTVDSAVLGSADTTEPGTPQPEVLAAVERGALPTTAPISGPRPSSGGERDQASPTSAPPISVAPAARRSADFGEFEDELASGDAALGIGELPSLTEMPVVLPSGEGDFSSTLPQTGGNAGRTLGLALMGLGMGLALVAFGASRREAKP